VPATELLFEREIELPREVVWDALIDEELVVGWLGEARIDPVPGGRYDIAWMHDPRLPPTRGVITELAAPSVLALTTESHGQLGFRLEQIAGGIRGSSTRLCVLVEQQIEPAFTAQLRAHWLVSLDQLEQLLRGHPVDWPHWQRDHGPSWSEYRDRFSAPRA
jgi:uncharacterized protein YndB with AHSA1/START domain